MLRRSVVAGTAGAFHHRSVEAGAAWAGNELWEHEVVQPALVLGSSQPRSMVDVDAAAAAGVEVVQRRSGGGAVWLAPGEVTWIDVIVRPGRPGWGSDVHTPMRHLGNVFAARVRELVAEEAGAPADDLVIAHRGPMVTTTWSRLVCFDGVGPGEVTLDSRKLLGISQRRTREWARLQCCWYHRYNPADVLRYLRSDGGEVIPQHDELRRPATIPREWSSTLVDTLAAAFGEGTAALDPAVSDPAGPNPAGPNPAGPDPAGPYPTGPDPAGPYPARPDPAGRHSSVRHSSGPDRSGSGESGGSGTGFGGGAPG